VFASYRWGRSGDAPVVGDWNGDGTQTVGVVRSNGARDSKHLLLRNADGNVLDFWYGRHGDRVLVGDWNGDCTWTPGVLRGGTRWYLKDSFTAAPPASAWPSRPRHPGGRRLGQPALVGRI
jgi:hypothetical protein